MPDNRQVNEGGLPLEYVTGNDDSVVQSTSAPVSIPTVFTTPPLEAVEQAQRTGVQLRTLREIIDDLKQPLPPRLIKTRSQGGAEIAYIEWQTAVRYLDAYAAGWSGRVTDVKPVNFEVIVGDRSPRPAGVPQTTRRVYAVEVTYAITIPTADFPQGVTRESTGFEIITSDRMYGNPVANAEAQAKKRAAAQFGLGLYLYDGDEGTPTTNSASTGVGF